MIAFTFPDACSPRPGVGRPWLGHPSWRVVGEVSSATGRDVGHLLLDADADELRRPGDTPLVTYTCGLIAADAASLAGLAPARLAGHSLGEYTALTAAGAVRVADGARLVLERNEAMGTAARRRIGGMATVVGVADEAVDLLCRRVDGDVWVAVHNAPGEVAVAGDVWSLARVVELASRLGWARVALSDRDGAHHTPLMRPARRRLRALLQSVDLRHPDEPVYANVDAQIHRDPSEWPTLLSAQLVNPVRWRQTVEALDRDGVSIVVELGPASGLTRLAQRTLDGPRAISVTGPADLDDLLSLLRDRSRWRVEPDGERLHMDERLVVSPASGVFSAPEDLRFPSSVAVGQVVGQVIDSVGEVPIRSTFAGELQGLLVLDGERVSASQPVAWLRSAPRRQAA